VKKAVLLIIDMINDGFENWDGPSRSALTTKINQLSQLFRSQGLPIIWVRQEFEADLSDAFVEMRTKQIRKYIKGTPGSALLSELIVSPDDDTVVKKRYSAFFGTDLDQKLAGYQPEMVVLAGVNTHACIRTTAVDAYQRDWNTLLAGECIDSYNREWHRSSLEYLEGRVAAMKTNQEIEALLG
jgi:maleamate amidohydrolase